MSESLNLKTSINEYKMKYSHMAFKYTGMGMAITQNGRRLRQLEGACNGMRAFIIGNGPTLKSHDLSLLKNEITIGCNGIFYLTDEIGFMPTFYTVEDRLVAEDRADKIFKFRGTNKIFPYDLKYILKPDDNTIYINFLRKYKGIPKFSSNFKEEVYWGGTVTFLNIQLAYYLGIREVYLIGMDHNYSGPNKNDEQKGFVITSHNPDANHFHPEYFGPGFRYHDPNVSRMEKAYVVARKFFESNGAEIYNATAGGKLEVFKRVDYKSLFKADK